MTPAASQTGMRPTVQTARDEHLLLRLKGLVLVRRLLEERGADASEIGAHTAEIARVRAQLARQC
jgi:hypothetical protein